MARQRLWPSAAGQAPAALLLEAPELRVLAEDSRFGIRKRMRQAVDEEVQGLVRAVHVPAGAQALATRAGARQRLEQTSTVLSRCPPHSRASSRPFGRGPGLSASGPWTASRATRGSRVRIVW